jgi:hypothetical protein
VTSLPHRFVLSIVVGALLVAPASASPGRSTDITVDPTARLGTHFIVPASGLYGNYSLVVSAGAWSPWLPWDPTSLGWKTLVSVYLNRSPIYPPSGGDPDRPDYVLGIPGYSDTFEDAAIQGKGSAIAIPMVAGYDVLLLASDCSDCYADNSGTEVVTVLPPPIPVTPWSQAGGSYGESTWQGDDPWDDSGTMQKNGCAVTAAAMLIHSLFPDLQIGGTAVTPQSLNDYLDQADGYVGYKLHWDHLDQLFDGWAFKSVKFAGGRTPESDEVLRSELDAGRPVILQVGPGEGHFVLATGEVFANGSMTFALNDPGYAIRQYLNDRSQPHTVNGQTTMHPGYGNDYRAIVTLSPTPKTMMATLYGGQAQIIVCATEAQLDIIDPLGRHLLPSGGPNSIPNTVDWSAERMLDDMAADTSTFAGPWQSGTQIMAPVAGLYRALVGTGANATQSRVSIFTYDSLGALDPPRRETVLLEAGQTDTIAFDYSPSDRSTAVPPGGASGVALGIRPNPSVGRVSIQFDLPIRSRVDVAIYDVAGHRIARVADGEWAAGRHTVIWPTSSGAAVPDGVYFVRLQAAGESHVRRIIVLR